jgi:acetoin utilization protein AcuB
MTIKDIMTKDVVTLKPTDSFKKAQTELKRVSFHHLLITNEDQELVGLISDRDMMSQVATYVDKNNGESFTDFLPRLTVADVMTRDIISIDEETPIATASILLLENNFSCLPIIDDKRLVHGIVTWKDLLKYYVYR